MKLSTGDSVLFIQIRAMGDTLMVTPAIRDFKKAYPGVSIDFIADPLPAQVLRNNPHIREIITLPSSLLEVKENIRIYKALRRANYKLAVDFLSIPRSSVETFLSGAEVRTGYRLRGRTWAYTHPVARGHDALYSALTKYDLLKDFGVTPSSAVPELFPNDSDYKWAENRIRQIEFNKSPVIIGLAPWSKREWRRWDMANWLSVMDSLNPDGSFHWLLFASEAEKAHLKMILNSDRHSIAWAGAPDILKASTLMKKCRLMLSAENGLMHIATASGVPSVACFLSTGDAPIVWTLPNSPIHRYWVCGDVLNRQRDVDGLVGVVESLICATSE